MVVRLSVRLLVCGAGLAAGRCLRHWPEASAGASSSQCDIRRADRRASRATSQGPRDGRCRSVGVADVGLFSSRAIWHRSAASPMSIFRRCFFFHLISLLGALACWGVERGMSQPTRHNQAGLSSQCLQSGAYPFHATLYRSLSSSQRVSSP
jgi:hypothetical protein